MLVTVKQLMASMGVTSALEADLTPTLTSVIVKAELRVGVELGSTLQALQGVDTFLPDPDHFCGVVPADGLRLKLSRKFARNTTANPLVVTVDGVEVPLDQVLLDLPSGMVSVPPEFQCRKIQVSYASGFKNGDELPPPLMESLLLVATMISSLNQAGEKESGAQESAKRAGDLAMGFLSQYKIIPSFSYRPVSSTQAALP